MKEHILSFIKSLPKRLPYIFGFIVMYCIPIILFGNLIPYTRDEIPAGLTKAGYFAVAVICLIIMSKIKQRFLQMPKSVVRGMLLSIFPILFWAIVNIGVGYVEKAIVAFSQYWDRVLIFIIIGRALYCIGDAVNAEHTEAKSDEQ